MQWVLRWLDSWPAGLKLNTELSRFYSHTFIEVVSLWGGKFYFTGIAPASKPSHLSRDPASWSAISPEHHLYGWHPQLRGHDNADIYMHGRTGAPHRAHLPVLFPIKFNLPKDAADCKISLEFIQRSDSLSSPLDSPCLFAV